MRKTISYIILALVALVTFTGCGSDEPKEGENTQAKSTKAERNYIAEGNSFYNKGEYGDAEAKYRKALEVNSASEIAQFNLASALLRQDPQLAKPSNAQQPQQQGGEAAAQDSSKQLQEAQAILSTLAENSASKEIASKSAYDLGNIAYKQQQYDQAIECYKQSLRKNPKYEEARYNLRMAQLKQKNNQNNQNKNQNQDQKDKDKDKDKQNQDKKDQDKDKNKDQDKDKNKDQDKQNQDKQNQDKQEKQNQQQQKGGMSQQNMEQILRTMQNQENATQQRVNARRAQQQAGERARTGNKW